MTNLAMSVSLLFSPRPRPSWPQARDGTLGRSPAAGESHSVVARLGGGPPAGGQSRRHGPWALRHAGSVPRPHDRTGDEAERHEGDDRIHGVPVFPAVAQV